MMTRAGSNEVSTSGRPALETSSRLPPQVFRALVVVKSVCGSVLSSLCLPPQRCNSVPVSEALENLCFQLVLFLNAERDHLLLSFFAIYPLINHVLERFRPLLFR